MNNKCMVDRQWGWGRQQGFPLDASQTYITVLRDRFELTLSVQRLPFSFEPYRGFGIVYIYNAKEADFHAEQDQIGLIQIGLNFPQLSQKLCLPHGGVVHGC